MINLTGHWAHARTCTTNLANTYNNLFLLSRNGQSANFSVSGGDLAATPVLISEDSANGTLNTGEAVDLSGGFTNTTLFYRGTYNGDPVFSTSASGFEGTFYVASDSTLSGNLGAFVTTTTVPVCFIAGTLISTPEGSTPIENLKPGDLISTVAGDKPVRFVSRTLHYPGGLADDGTLPVRICKDALGGLGPSRDLHVSPDHAILVDGHLVHASALVNGSSIIQTELSDWDVSEPIVYLNVELDAHMLIKAEGLTVESFIDNQPRSNWDNYTAYLTLYDQELPIQELSMPRVKYARQIPSALKLSLEAMANSTNRELVAV